MDDSIYFPIDHDKVMKLCASKDGLVIPQSYFNVPNYHLTIYVKDLIKNPDRSKVDIHLTNDKTKEKIPLSYFEFDKDDIKKYFESKFEILHNKIMKHKEYVQKNQIKPNKNMVCMDCALRKRYLKDFDFSNKEESNNLIKYLENMELEKHTLLNFPICNETRHTLAFDIKADKAYYKLFDMLIEFEYTEVYVADLVSIFQNELGLVEKILDKIKEKYNTHIR